MLEKEASPEQRDQVPITLPPAWCKRKNDPAWSAMEAGIMGSLQVYHCFIILSATMCGVCIWPEPNSQYLVCGISIALSDVQSASGIMRGGKRLFFSPLHATVVCIYSGEGNI